jgi:heme A synthase
MLDFGGVTAYTMLHRGAVLVIGLLLLYVLTTALRQWPREGIGRWAGVTLVVLVVQIAVGAGAAVTDAAFFNGLHVALATLVFTGVLATALSTLPRADRRPEPARLSVVERSSA